MTGRQLAKALRSGKHVYGTLVVSHSPRWLDVIGKLGLDFVFIDTEHIAIDRIELSWMCNAYRALGIAPIVRIPSPDPYYASMVMDGGANGIIAPYVETVEQVKTLSGAVKLRPIKGMRLQKRLEDGQKFEKGLETYLEERNRENILIVNIESIPAIENLDDILQVKELDGVLIGPHDLSCSLGIPEQYHLKKFDKAVRGIFEKARQHNKGAGIHYWQSIKQEIAWYKTGANLIVHGIDLISFVDSMEKDLTYIRKALGDDRQKKKRQNINI
jgi:4-hydroxy-2-oxoheptanedioate aldolase